MKRETWRTLALLAAGWFIHDAVWHVMLVLFGMTGLISQEFSLPDLQLLGIHPDPATQTLAFVVAVVLGGACLLLARRLRPRG